MYTPPRMPHRERKPKRDKPRRPGLTPATRAKKAIMEVELPFRVLIAVHRPRYRGRAGRAAQITSWDVISLLNKQDPVGICSKAPSPPDILILSGDFGLLVFLWPGKQRLFSRQLRLPIEFYPGH